MMNCNISKIKRNSRELIKSFNKKMSWKWDERFETVLAQFGVKEKDWVHKILERHMGNIWAKENKSEAPEIIKPIIEYFGGLEPGHKFYTSALDEEYMILCAWWPWRNDKTISIRLSVVAHSLSEEDNDELMRMFRNWFDL